MKNIAKIRYPDLEIAPIEGLRSYMTVILPKGRTIQGYKEGRYERTTRNIHIQQ